MGPFPRLHFFLISQAPLLDPKASQRTTVNVKELTSQAYSARNFYSNVKADDGKYLALSLVYRGGMTTQEVDKEVEALQSKNADDFVEWIPNNIKSGIVEVAPKTSEASATFIANTTALKGIFQRLATQLVLCTNVKLSYIGIK